MGVKVAILDDNIASPRSFKGEHGLSVMVEVEGRSFLWDCGQTDLAVGNARALGIDLKLIEGIGISHGHFDHAGGLMSIMAESGPKRIFMHPAALEPKFFAAGDIRMFIGIPFSRAAMEGSSLGLELAREPVEVMPGVHMTGEVPRVTDFEKPEPNLFHERDGSLELDPFDDDQALVVETPQGAVVLTGCAHCGVCNIAKYVQDNFGEIRAMIGGTHLELGSAGRMEPTLEFLGELGLEKMVFCHCTGITAIARMIHEFGDSFVPGRAGLVMEL